MAARRLQAVAMMFLALALIQPAAARAQTPAPAVRTGDNVWVTLRDGRVVTGRVESVSAPELAIRHGAQSTRVRWTDVSTVDARVADSWANGAVIGGAIGGLGGGLGSLLIMNLICSECENGEDAKTIGLVSGAIGAGVGALIDRERYRRRQVYRASTIAVAPTFGRGRIGLGLIARW